LVTAASLLNVPRPSVRTRREHRGARPRAVTLAYIASFRSRHGSRSGADVPGAGHLRHHSAQRLNQGLTLSQLSESLMVSNGNVTGVVARLIEDGLVTRTVDQQDRRSATVRLTRKGRDMFLKIAAAHEQWIETMFADLSDNQTADLLRLLTRLRRSIESHPL
jgi:DNA-binding MarR family transcriptional regulator